MSTGSSPPLILLSILECLYAAMSKGMVGMADEILCSCGHRFKIDISSLVHEIKIYLPYLGDFGLNQFIFIQYINNLETFLGILLRDENVNYKQLESL